jgi:hypothetical protein|tara:strand:- start:150 stop:353 length:204 start_codon:yes stop_codon:yes gene_type:complete
MVKFTKEEQKVYDFLLENSDIGIEEVLDVVIKSNGICGVGLIRIEDICKQAIKKYYKNESLDKIMNG